jgi:hypothetical protein
MGNGNSTGTNVANRMTLALFVTGADMSQFRSNNGPDKEHGIFDYLLYALAGSVLAAFSFSFLLWLRL